MNAPGTRSAPETGDASAGAPRILISDPLDAIALETFRARGLEPDVAVGLDEDALAQRIGAYDALVVRSGTRVTRRVLEAAARLKVVGRAGIGVDNVDCDAATERGIVVMNTPAGNATTTAEHALALLVSLARHIPLADRSVRAGQWKKKGLLGTELTGKTLGIVGLGRIGRLLADRARGLHMDVVAYDPYLEPGADVSIAGVVLVTFDELLARSDFVSLHVPLTDATRNLISWEATMKMKPGARLINASRGGVVDEEAVLDALVEGRLAGAAFDVLEKEPPPADHPLLRRDDVIVTPHLGASSHEAQHKVAADIAKQIADFLLEGVAQNAVNAPPLSRQELAILGPFLVLAERIGSFLAQRIAGPIRKLELTVAGEVARHDAGHLRRALLAGILRHGVGAETVNFVNAEGVARERGLRLLEGIDDEPWYRDGQIKVRASTRAGGTSRLVTGTVFGREPRIVRIDDVHLDLPPDGPLLITRHRDVPGVVGQLGTVLGKHGINIRRIELGPPRDGSGLACGFLTLYDVPSADVLEALRALDPIEEVQLVRLG